MKRFLLTIVAGLALLGTAQAQTAATSAEAGLPSNPNSAAGTAPLTADQTATDVPGHTTMASDAPAANPAVRPTIEPAGGGAGSTDLSNTPTGIFVSRQPRQPR